MTTLDELLTYQLENFYDRGVLSRGYDYYLERRVKKFVMREGTITASVRGSYGKSYKVEIDHDIHGEYLDIWCECPYEEGCKHEVAVIHKLLESSSFKQKEKKIKKKKFKVQQSGQFRSLEMLQDLPTTIKAYSPRSIRDLLWFEKIDAKVVSDNILEIATFNDSVYNRTQKSTQKISLKINGKEIEVKCLSCNTSTDLLCEHQATILSAVGGVLHRYGVGDPLFSVEGVKKEACEKFEVTEDVFDKYYMILLSDNGFVSYNRKLLMPPTWAQTANEIFEQKNNEEVRHQNLSIATEMDGRPRRYGFMWSWEFDRFPELSFISGYALKTKEGIHGTGRIIEDYPNMLPEPYQDLGHELSLLSRKSDLASSFTEAHELLKAHIAPLNEIYQYVLKSDLYQRVSSKHLHLFKFDREMMSCKFLCKKEDGFIHLTRHLTKGDMVIDYVHDVLFSNLLFSVVGDRAYLHSNYFFHHLMALFDDLDTLVFSPDDTSSLVALIHHLEENFVLEYTDDILPPEEILGHPEYSIYLKEHGEVLTFEPRMTYGDIHFNPFDKNICFTSDKLYKPEDSDVAFFRNFIKKAHPIFDETAFSQNYVTLDFKSVLNDYWFLDFAEACEATGITLLGQKELRKFNYSTKKPIALTHVKSGIDWFDVKVELSFGDEKVKTAEWIRAIRNRESFVTLKDGSLGMMPDKWISQVKRILDVSEKEKNQFKITKYRFNVIEDLFENIEDKKLLKELREKKKRLLEYDFGKSYDVPDIVDAELRQYQKHGYQWLKFLEESEFGGILADDMGLGKTMQAISLLADQKGGGTSLVIVPRTLLFNWSAELNKFCKPLNYVIHHGTGRSKDLDEYHHLDVIISTYGTVASDIEKFKEQKYNYVILDESQAIKNPDSKRYKAIRLLNSRNKLAMTGTPIENNTMDLYAQFSFTSPGLLGSKNHFKQHFAIPIDNHRDEKAAKLLRKMIHPFILRRTKDQVAKDLPEKTESIIYCEMGATQRKLYENLKEKIKEDIHKSVKEKGVEQSKFMMLDGLLRLRQLCNSPLLVNESFKGASAESVKIDMLCQYIVENLEGHSTLIFSQFVKLLSIVRAELDKRSIPYAYLDGSTRKRKKEVDRFMKNDDVRIFLISLKAGNTGMNLTKADYVYILDPWWNPAVEAQAIDRTHRIGQDKQIFAYKMICKDTIEEKIVKLQERKKELARDIVQIDENVLKSLDKTELLALFD